MHSSKRASNNRADREQLPCQQNAPCVSSNADIRGNIAVEWLSDAKQCTPSLLNNGSAWAGPSPLRNVSIGCDQHNASLVLEANDEMRSGLRGNAVPLG